MFTPPVPAPNTVNGQYIAQMIQTMIQNPLFGATVEHFQAQLATPEQFDNRGRPDYLAPAPGVYESGVVYVANPANPLKGIFCQAKRQPIQEKGGIYYQAQYELYLPVDLGAVFVLDAKYPKRQDKFVIQGRTYYAIAPSMPCQMGETTAAWKIELNLERYPVQN